MSSSQAVAFVVPTGFRVTPKVAAWSLPAVLAIGFVLRIGASLTQTHTLFSGETLQYFEQGHRLAFNSGIVPWNFAAGMESWLLPGLIALAMRATAWVSDDPMLYVGLVRSVCVVLSMVIVLIGYRVGEREAGRIGALITGGFCAIWFDLIYFSPAVMTEVLSAHCAIVALFLGEGRRTMRLGYWTGALFGAAICLHYQYTPALALAMIWQYREAPRHWQWLFLGASSVLLPFSGVLDAITWGAAFQSIWLNFVRNLLEGIEAATGTQTASFYLDYFTIALLPLPLMFGLAILGATRFPSLAIAALATAVTQSLLPHKEIRFVYLTIAAAPILIGLGCTYALRLSVARYGARALTLGAPLFLGFAAVLSCYIGTEQLGARWSYQRGMVNTFLAAHREHDLCGLQVRDIPAWRSGGYTYLNRDVPLMFDPYMPEFRLRGSPFTLRFLVERTGGPVSQVYSQYSHIIAEAAHRPADTSPVACFAGNAAGSDPELCLFRRRAGCRLGDGPVDGK